MQQVTIGDVQFLGVPASELPGWVMSKQWPMATFVEAVDGYPSSEGIYFYTTQTHENWPWADGASDHPPEYFAEPYLQKGIRLSKYSARSLPIGFRGEYSAAYFRQPMTYMSQIDNRLHLLYAQGGVWNLGDGQVLRMHNLSGGAYIDGWTREQVPPDEDEAGSPRAAPGTIEEVLYALDGFLIYSGPQGSELRRAEYSLSRFELHPPTDKATWLAFREQMAPYRGQERDPADLKRWLADFAGHTLIATKGKISDVRATDRGFRFVIDLQPGFEILGFGGLQGLKPGAYVMTYDGKWQMAPLTPPALSAALIGTTLTQLQPGALQVALRNDGRQDLPQATLELQAAPPGGSATVVATQTVALLAQSPITATFQWVAPSAGQWTLTPAIRRPDGVRSAFAPAQITVLPAPDATPGGIVAASIAPGNRPLVVLGLVMFATIAALVFWRQSIVFPAEKSR